MWDGRTCSSSVTRGSLRSEMKASPSTQHKFAKGMKVMLELENLYAAYKSVLPWPDFSSVLYSAINLCCNFVVS